MEPLDGGDLGLPVLTVDNGLTSSVPHPSRVLFMVPLGPGWESLSYLVTLSVTSFPDPGDMVTHIQATQGWEEHWVGSLSPGPCPRMPAETHETHSPCLS